MPLLLVAAAILLALSYSGEIRARAEAALGRGMPAREAALARGFVLGEDEQIDEGTTEDFRRAGLSHLLAVSGQNVALLVLLAMPVLAALGLPLRTRLLWVLGLIAVYVPLAGAGPSIKRAGIMGALSVLATLAGRRTSRFYALVFAAAVLLVLEPGIASDVGWQLSFAAVLGILLLVAPLRAGIAVRIGTRGLRRALAEGAAVTIAATLATAPLIAFHFEAISTVTLVANLLALPAVAPAMWLGMMSAAAGQVPGLPVGALNAVNSLLLAYIAQVAAWCGRPSWAYLHVRLGVGGLVGSYLAIAAAVLLAMRMRRRRRRLRLGGPALAIGLVALGLAWAWGVGAADGGATPDHLRACGSPSSMSGRAMRSCCSHAARRLYSLTVGRLATGLRRNCAPPGSPGSVRRSSPTISQTTGVGSRSCLALYRSGASSTGSCENRLWLRSPPRGFPAAASPGEASCDRAGCGSTCSGHRPSCSRACMPAKTPTSWPWSCWPAGAASRCC